MCLWMTILESFVEAILKALGRPPSSLSKAAWLDGWPMSWELGARTRRRPASAAVASWR